MQFKKIFTADRLERLDRMIEASNATMYSKLANCVLDLKKQDNKDVKKKRGWSESEWKKHMDYIGQMAAPKRDFKPDAIKVCEIIVMRAKKIKYTLIGWIPKLQSQIILLVNVSCIPNISLMLF